MNPNIRVIFIFVYILLHYGNNAVEARNPEAVASRKEHGKHGAKGGFKLIEVDIKKRKSNDRVKYKFDEGKNSHTFKAMEPYLIDRVTREGQVLWDAADHGNQYCNEVFVGEDDKGKRIFRVFYPKDHEKAKLLDDWDRLDGRGDKRDRRHEKEAGHAKSPPKAKNKPLADDIVDLNRHLLNLNIDNTESTRIVKYEIDYANDRDIFTANRPYAFVKVTRGKRTLWKYKGGDYPTRVFVDYDDDDNAELSFHYHERDPIDQFKYPRKIYETDDDSEFGVEEELEAESPMAESETDTYDEMPESKSRALVPPAAPKHVMTEEPLITKIVELHLDAKIGNFHHNYFEDTATDSAVYVPQPGHFFYKVKFQKPLNESTLNFVTVWGAEEDGRLAHLVLVGGLASPHSVTVFYTDGTRRFFHIDSYYQLLVSSKEFQVTENLDSAHHPKKVEIVTVSRKGDERVNDTQGYSVSVFKIGDARTSSSLTGPAFEYLFHPGVLCVELSVRDKLVWERRSGRVVKAVHYLESLNLVAIQFTNLRTALYKFQGKKWVLLNADETM